MDCFGICNKCCTSQHPCLLIFKRLYTYHSQQVSVVTIRVDLPLSILIHVQGNFDSFSIYLIFVLFLLLNAIYKQSYPKLLFSVVYVKVSFFFCQYTTLELQILNAVTWDIVSWQESPYDFNFLKLYLKP